MKIQKKQQGFTLIELMIVIAIVGILAAVALPAYQDYTVRAKLSEALGVLAEAKTSVGEFYIANNAFPADAQEAGIRSDIDTDIVASLLYSTAGNGNFGVKVKQAVVPGAAGDVIFGMSVVSSAGGTLAYKCVRQPNNITGTAIEGKYLPANCRT